MAAQNKNTLVSNSEEDDSLFEYLNSLSPLKSKKYDGVGAIMTLNALGPVYSPFITRNNSLNTSMPKVSSENVNKIYSHEEAPKDSTHAWIDTSELRDPLISSDDAKYLLELLGKQESVTDDSSERHHRDDAKYLLGRKDSVVGQKNTNKMKIVASSSKHEIKDSPSEPIAATDKNQTLNNLSNPIERGDDDDDDELVRIRRSIQRRCQGYEPEKTSLQRNNIVYTSNISSCTSKSVERNASNEKPLLPRKNTSDSHICVLQGNNAVPALKHEKEEVSVDFCQTIPKKKRKVDVGRMTARFEDELDCKK